MSASKRQDHFALDVKALRLIEENKHLYFQMPGHPLANKHGFVALHRHVMSVTLKRWITPNEVVIFVNGDSLDVRPHNLELTTRSRTARRENDGSAQVELVCSRPRCGVSYWEFSSHAARRRYCSRECAIAASRKFDLSRKELEQLVWEMPTTHIARDFEVSDKTIEKRCRLLEISKPPRGYWAKLHAGQVDPEVKDQSKQLPRQELNQPRRTGKKASKR
jgi:hypothetical protein